jgi:hypothetical protein
MKICHMVQKFVKGKDILIWRHPKSAFAMQYEQWAKNTEFKIMQKF